MAKLRENGRDQNAQTVEIMKESSVAPYGADGLRYLRRERRKTWENVDAYRPTATSSSTDGDVMDGWGPRAMEMKMEIIDS